MHKKKRWPLVILCLVLLMGSGTGIAYADACPSGGEHTYAGDLIYQATEEEEGLQVFTCLKCGDTFNRVIPAFGHHWGEWIVEVEPTCVNQGYSYRVCNNYSGAPHYEEKILDRLSATGEHSYIVEHEESATCLEEGYREYRCSACGDAYVEPIAPLGHQWDEWHEEVDPATLEKREVRTCQLDSSHVEYRDIPTKESGKESSAKPLQATNSKQNSQLKTEDQSESTPWFTFSFTPNVADAVLLAGDMILLAVGIILIIPFAFQLRWIREKRKESLNIYVEQGLAKRKEK